MNRKKKKQPQHLTWAEICAILAECTRRVHGTFTYLPAAHPELFCQSLSVIGQQLEKLTVEAGKLAKDPPTAGHDHAPEEPMRMDYPRKNRPKCPRCKLTVLEGQPCVIFADGTIIHELCEGLAMSDKEVTRPWTLIHRKRSIGLFRSLRELQDDWNWRRDAGGEGSSTWPDGEVTNGVVTYRISYNGRIWEGDYPSPEVTVPAA